MSTDFTLNEVKKLRIQLNKKFAEIGEDLGLNLKFDRITYGDEVRFKMHITKKVNADAKKTTDNADIGAPGFSVTTVNNAKQRWDAYCRGFGLKPEHFNATFRQGNSTYRIIDCKPSRPKYPVIVETNRGAKYKMSPTQIKMYCMV